VKVLPGPRPALAPPAQRLAPGWPRGVRRPGPWRSYCHIPRSDRRRSLSNFPADCLAHSESDG
jgi:hypothetical protein